MAAISLRTGAEIPWPSTGGLGMGVVAPSGELLGTAVNPFRAEPGSTLDVHVTVKDVETASDLREVLGVEADTQFHTPAIAGEAMARFEKTVEHSERARTILYAIICEWKAAALASPVPSLTEAAAALLHEDRMRFRDAFGDYFIAGYTKKAQFLAFAHLTSRDEAALTKVAARVQAELQTAGSALSLAAATAMDSESHQHDCRMTLEVHMSGLRDDPSSTLRSHQSGLSMSDIPALANRFVENADGSPTTAKLIHYHRIDPDFPTTIDIDRQVFLDAEELYDDLLDAEAMLARLPRRYRPRMQERLETIDRRIAAEVPRDLNCTLDTIKTLAEGENGLAEWRRDADQVIAYLALWRTAVTSPQGVVNCAPPATIEAIPPVVVHESYQRPGHIDVDLVFEPRGIRKRVGPAGRGYHDAPLGPAFDGLTLDGRRVCGFRFGTGRSSGTRGRCWVTSGGVGQDNISFHMRSGYDRGLDWTVEVFTVPADNFDFVDPDDR